MNRWEWFAILLILSLGLTHAAFWRRIEFLHWDGCYYSGMAESLYHTHTYRFNESRHIPYPPGMPLILAGIMTVFGEAYAPQIVAVGVFGAFGLAAAFLLLRISAGFPLNVWACLLLLTSSTFFGLNTTMILSDTAYFLTSTVCVLLAMSLADQGEHDKGTLWRASALALLTPASFLIRPIGVALVAGLGLWLGFLSLFHRTSFSILCRRIGPALITGTLSFLWWTWFSRSTEILEWPGQYLHSHWKQLVLKDYYSPELGRMDFGDLVLRISENTAAMGAVVSTFVTNQWINPFLSSPAVILPILLIVLGLTATIRERGVTLLETYFCVYVAILSLWPFAVGMDRFLFPVMPLALLYIYRGCRYIAYLSTHKTEYFWEAATKFGAALATVSVGHVFLAVGGKSKQSLAATGFWTAVLLVSLAFRRMRWQIFTERTTVLLRGVAGCILVAICLLGLRAQIRMAVDNLNPRPSPRAVEKDAALWLYANTPADAIVMAEQVSIFHRFSRRRTIHFPITSNPAVILETMSRYNVRFLAVNDGPQDFRYLPTQQDRVAKLQEAYPKQLRLIARTPGYRIFQVASD